MATCIVTTVIYINKCTRYEYNVDDLKDLASIYMVAYGAFLYLLITLSSTKKELVAYVTFSILAGILLLLHLLLVSVHSNPYPHFL